MKLKDGELVLNKQEHYQTKICVQHKQYCFETPHLEENLGVQHLPLI